VRGSKSRCRSTEHGSRCDEYDGIPAKHGISAVYMVQRVEGKQVCSHGLYCDWRRVLLACDEGDMGGHARTSVECERYTEKDSKDLRIVDVHRVWRIGSHIPQPQNLEQVVEHRYICQSDHDIAPRQKHCSVRERCIFWIGNDWYCPEVKIQTALPAAS
jgi:hypothetical protein